MHFEVLDEREDSDSIRLKLYHESGEEIGYIDIAEIINGYWWFETEEVSEEQYDSMVPDDKFLLIQMVDVYPKFRRKGYANIMMGTLPQYLKQYFPKYDVFVLNASPIQSLPLEILIEFYKKFGYEELTKSDVNCTMIKNN